MIYTAPDFEKVFDIVAHIERALNKALAIFAQEENWKGRTGGYFCLADKESGMPLFITQVGEVPKEKAGKYLSFCQEKAGRLAQNKAHWSSWQSRNPDQEKWGGAVRTEIGILSFSGLPELGDEAVMLVVRCLTDHMYWATVQEEKEIAAFSNNRYFIPLVQPFNR